MGAFLGSIALAVIAVITTTVGTLYFYFTRNFKFWKNLDVPYLDPQPFLGNLKDVFFQKVDMASNLKNLHQETKDKPYVGIFAFDKPVLVVNDLDLVKKVLVKDSQIFIDHNANIDETVDPVFGRVLFMLRGKKWKHLRTNLSPIFTSGKMKLMFYLVEECGKELVRCLDRESAGGASIAVQETLARFTTDAISTCALGIESNTLKNPDAEMRNQMRRVFSFSSWKGVVGLLMFFAPDLLNVLRFRFLDAQTANFFKDTVRSTVEYRKKNGVVRKDLLDSLIELKRKTYDEPENGNGAGDEFKLDEDMLVAQAFAIFAGGFETSSSTTTFALFQLAWNPDIQQRLREEVLENLEKHNQQVTYDGINEMEYLDMVVSETLRMYPVLGFLDRTSVRDYEIPSANGKGTTILPKGTVVYIPLFGFHNNPEHFPNPEKFDPERFTEEIKQTRHNYAYMPFGEGPRVCIGKRFGLMQVKTALMHILANYEVTPCEGTPRALQFDPKAFTMQSITEIKLNFKRIGN